MKAGGEVEVKTYAWEISAEYNRAKDEVLGENDDNEEKQRSMRN